MNTKLFRKSLIDLGISQNQFAKKLGMHPQMLSSIVRGYRNPRPEIKAMIAFLLGVKEIKIFNRNSGGSDVSK